MKLILWQLDYSRVKCTMANRNETSVKNLLLRNVLIYADEKYLLFEDRKKISEQGACYEYC